jgi:hypothetical protein
MRSHDFVSVVWNCMYIIISLETEFILNIYNSVRISQETHYVSSTKTNGMMLREKSPFIVREVLLRQKVLCQV